jgi:imidazolonepropionase-like amidohydrolase
MSAEMLAKNDLVIDGGLRSLQICKRAGVPVAYGSDLLGQLQVDQSREFLLRREVLTPAEIVRQATVVGAEVLGQVGKLGVIAPGAWADLLVVDGDPLRDLELLTGQGERLLAIMNAGRFHKNGLKG